MSKKLIAVASAAALALTGLVGIAPATATGPSATFSAGTTAGTTTGISSSAPAEIIVPDRNTLTTTAASGNSSTGGATLATITVSNLATGDVIRYEATGSVKLVEGNVARSLAFDATKAGVSTLTKTISNTTTPSVFAYTTSTTTGTVVVTLTRTGLTSSSTLHLKGIAGEVYNLAPVSGVPATLTTAATSVVVFTATDVFGNKLESSGVASTIDGFAKSNMGTVTYDANAKNYRSTMTSPSKGPFIASIIGTVADVDGFADSADNLIAVVNNAGVSTQVANLTAQVAALTTQLAATVTKKKYNKLARKWNRAFPSQKVKLQR